MENLYDNYETCVAAGRYLFPRSYRFGCSFEVDEDEGALVAPRLTVVTGAVRGVPVSLGLCEVVEVDPSTLLEARGVQVLVMTTTEGRNLATSTGGGAEPIFRYPDYDEFWKGPADILAEEMPEHFVRTWNRPHWVIRTAAARSLLSSGAADPL